MVKSSEKLFKKKGEISENRWQTVKTMKNCENSEKKCEETVERLCKNGKICVGANSQQPSANSHSHRPPLLTPLLSSVKGGADQKTEEKI